MATSCDDIVSSSSRSSDLLSTLQPYVETTLNSAELKWKIDNVDCSATLSSTRAIVHVNVYTKSRRASQTDTILQQEEFSVLLADEGIGIHYLPPASSVEFSFKLEEVGLNSSEDNSQGIVYKLCANIPGREESGIPFWIGSSEVVLTPSHSLGNWVYDAPGDWFICFAIDLWEVATNQEDEDGVGLRRLLESAYKHGIFTLEENVPVLTLEPAPVTLFMPNPLLRYCLNVGDPTIRWNRSKKVKKYAKDFRLSLNFDYAASLERLARYHNENGGTWFTSGMLKLFTDMHNTESDCQVHMAVFELWQGEALVAVTGGYGVGQAFHDFSMATFLRDHRSCGTLLSKAVGHLLHEAGYKIWYWGFKNPYMADFDDHYGGKELSRQDFKECWGNLVNCADETPSSSFTRFQELQTMLKAGRGLVAPRL